MKEKIKKVLKNRMFIFVCGGLLFSSVSVFAVTYFPSNQVTYDNKTSGLKATQVQAAIDELYNTCKNNTSSSGGSGNYIYFTYSGGRNLISDGIYRMPINGGSLTQLSVQESDRLPYNNADNLFVSGNYIYFTYRDPNVPEGITSGIYKMPINGGSLTKIEVQGSNSRPYFYADNISIY